MRSISSVKQFGKVDVSLLGDIVVGFDWIDGGYGGQLACGGPDQIADLPSRDAGNAVNGRKILQKPRFNWACSTWAFADKTAALASKSAWTASSYSSWLMALSLTSGA